MKPCASINAFFDATFTVPVRQQMQRVADAGFRHLDMNFWDWSHSPDSPFRKDDWRDWVNGIRSAAADEHVVFTQAHAHVYNFHDYKTDNVHEESIRRSIEGAGMLGIQWIVLHPSQRADYESEGSLDQMLTENCEYFTKHALRAKEFGVGLALENMSSAKSGLTSAEQLCRLIDMIGMDNVGACWDTGHANLAGCDQYASICKLGSRLHALHIADNYAVNDDHMPPFFGTVDWKAVTKALRDIDYDGDFTFEAHNIVRKLPESCKEEGLRLMYRIGETLVFDA